MKRLDRWMFGHGSPVSLAMMRIIAGFLAFGQLLIGFIDFEAWYTERGFLPTAVINRFLSYQSNMFKIGEEKITLPFEIPRFMPLNWTTSEEITLIAYLATMVAALLFMVGWRTKAMGILLAIGLIAVHYRAVLIIHSGDTLLRLIVIYLACSACGAALSLDRLRDHAGEPLPDVPLWPQRLIGIQVAIAYLMTVLWKAQGVRWRDGTATWYPSVMDEFFRFPMPPIFDQQPFIMIATYGTLAIEFALVILPWVKSTRKWVLIGGLLLHAGIEWRFNIPLFSYVIVSAYLSYYRGEEVSAWMQKFGARLQKLRPWAIQMKPGTRPEKLEALNSFGWPAFYAPDK